VKVKFIAAKTQSQSIQKQPRLRQHSQLQSRRGRAVNHSRRQFHHASIDTAHQGHTDLGGTSCTQTAWDSSEMQRTRASHHATRQPITNEPWFEHAQIILRLPKRNYVTFGSLLSQIRLSVVCCL